MNADDTSSEPRASRPSRTPRTPADWRDLLRQEELPEEFGALPRRQRRRARRRWRSARRDEHTRWISEQRRRTPTPLVIPLVALLVAGVVTAVSLWPRAQDESTRPRKPTPAPTVVSPAPSRTSASPTAEPTVAMDDPDQVAKAFATAYCTRRPLQDGTHAGAVERAEPYASGPLVANLKRHEDRDFNELVAAQAIEATPSTVKVALPDAADRPAADSSIRVWRKVTVTVDVQATEPYSYQRVLTLEVSRADTDRPWMVTRVLGVKE